MVARLTQGAAWEGVRACMNTFPDNGRTADPGAAWEGVCACMDTFPDSGHTADPGCCMGGGVGANEHVP